MKCCVYSRFYYDTPYVEFFIEHYLNLGFDKIYLLQGDNVPYKLPNRFRNKVTIKRVKNLGNEQLPIHDHIVKNSGMDWVLCIDTDEFLMLDNKFTNIKDYLTYTTTQNKKLTSIYFRWGVVEKYNNVECNDITDLINRHHLYSNHNIKTMAKVNVLSSIHHPHIVKTRGKSRILFEGDILTKHNANIARDEKIKDISYDEAFLLHLHTRSIKSLVIKCLSNSNSNRTNITSSLQSKIIKRPDEFEQLLETHAGKNIQEVFKLFTSCIGVKANIPFHHAKYETIHKDYILDKYNMNLASTSIIDVEVETKLLDTVFKRFNMSLEHFIRLEDRINEYVLTNKYFNY